jgi:hypothetical protein
MTSSAWRQGGNQHASMPAVCSTRHADTASLNGDLGRGDVWREPEEHHHAVQTDAGAEGGTEYTSCPGAVQLGSNSDNHPHGCIAEGWAEAYLSASTAYSGTKGTVSRAGLGFDDINGKACRKSSYKINRIT